MHHEELRIYNHIKFYRRMNNITQEALGKMVGRTDRTIAHLERGSHSPSFELALRMAKVFDVPVTQLFFEKENEPKLRIVRE